MISVLYAFLVLGAFGLLFGFGLALASKFFHVEVDTRVEDITKMLPNYNCGACGNPGCAGFAEKIVSGEAEHLSACKPGNVEKHFNPILQYLKDHPNADGSINKIKI